MVSLDSTSRVMVLPVRVLTKLMFFKNYISISILPSHSICFALLSWVVIRWCLEHGLFSQCFGLGFDEGLTSALFMRKNAHVRYYRIHIGNQHKQIIVTQTYWLLILVSSLDRFVRSRLSLAPGMAQDQFVDSFA